MCTNLFFCNCFTAEKFISKQFTDKARLIVSSNVWMNQIPTKECDVLITFPKSAKEETVKWLLHCFRGRVPELIVRVRYHSNTKIWGLYFTTNNKT